MQSSAWIASIVQKLFDGVKCPHDKQNFGFFMFPPPRLQIRTHISFPFEEVWICRRQLSSHVHPREQTSAVRREAPFYVVMATNIRF